MTPRIVEEHDKLRLMPICDAVPTASVAFVPVFLLFVFRVMILAIYFVAIPLSMGIIELNPSYVPSVVDVDDR